MYAPPLWLIGLGAALTACAVAGALYAWRPSRDGRRIALAAAASAAAFVVWRAALIVSNGANLDIDYDVLLGLSFEDIGSGILSFVFTALVLGLGIDGVATAGRVVRTAGLAAIAAIVVDRFV